LILKRHFLGWWAGLSLLLCLLTGCHAPNEETLQNQPITLEVWTLQLNTFADTLTPIFKDFEAAHPGVKIKWLDIPFSEGEKRTLTALMSGETPDVINLNPDFSAILANRKALVNMSEALTPEEQSVYLPVAWQAVSMKIFQNMQTAQSASNNTMTFGLPWYLTSSVTFYNQKALKLAGWQAPPTTFDELEAFSKALQKATHSKQPVYAVMPTLAESGNFLKELVKVGIPLYDEQTGKAIFADEGAGEHLAYWVKAYQENRVPKESITEGHRAAVNQYQSNALAMLLVGPSFVKILSENAQETLKTTHVTSQFPKTGKTIDFATMLLAVPVKSKHPKEAVELARFITNPENQLKLAKAAPVLPSCTESLKSPWFKQTQSSIPNELALSQEARRLSANQLLSAKSAYQIRPEQRAINERMNFFVQMALLGKMDPKEAMKKAQDEINQQILARPASK
jgi:putative chitobiose transport system substrate-binding protein